MSHKKALLGESDNCKCGAGECLFDYCDFCRGHDMTKIPCPSGVEWTDRMALLARAALH